MWMMAAANNIITTRAAPQGSAGARKAALVQWEKERKKVRIRLTKIRSPYCSWIFPHTVSLHKQSYCQSRRPECLRFAKRFCGPDPKAVRSRALNSYTLPHENEVEWRTLLRNS